MEVASPPLHVALIAQRHCEHRNCELPQIEPRMWNFSPVRTILSLKKRICRQLQDVVDGIEPVDIVLTIHGVEFGEETPLPQVFDEVGAKSAVRALYRWTEKRDECVRIRVEPNDQVLDDSWIMHAVELTHATFLLEERVRDICDYLQSVYENEHGRTVDADRIDLFVHQGPVPRHWTIQELMNTHRLDAGEYVDVRYHKKPRNRKRLWLYPETHPKSIGKQLAPVENNLLYVTETQKVLAVRKGARSVYMGEHGNAPDLDVFELLSRGIPLADDAVISEVVDMTDQDDSANRDFVLTYQQEQY